MIQIRWFVSLLFGCTLALQARTANANTLVVDATGSGGAFTDIPLAVAAAQPFDVILVHPGSYSGFAVSTNLTIVGTGPNVVVGNGTRIHAVPAGQRVVLADLRLLDLRINNCSGSVVLDGITIPPNNTPFAQYLTVDDCDDVRAIQCNVGLGVGFHENTLGVHVNASRVEFVQSGLRGAQGVSTSCGSGGPGADALRVTSSARVHLASTTATGGNGGAVFYACPEFCNQGAGDGGPAVRLSGASELLAMGRSNQLLKGGAEGDGSDCPCDGDPGTGVIANASMARWSGCTPAGGFVFCPPTATGLPFATQNGGIAVQESSLAPFLERIGTPAPGQLVQFDVVGLPGDVVELRVGRGTALNPIPGVQIEELTTVLRVFQMGTIGASGVASLTLLPPASLPHGFDFYAQAVVFRAGSELRTNSAPVVLR